MTTSAGSNISASVGGGVSGLGNAVSNPSIGSAVGAAVGVAGAVAGTISAIASMIPAHLICIDPRYKSLAGTSFSIIPFDFNPEKITISRSASLPQPRPSAGPGSGAPTGSQGAIVSKTNMPEISISDITFEGLTTKLRCDTLLNWMGPPGGASAGALVSSLATAGRPIKSEPANVTFQWGLPLVGFLYQVWLTNATIVYERFNPMGIPVRAKVSLKMSQRPSLLGSLPTNPTSGGQPGRHTHVVKQGDSLASIAMTYYETPSAWRPIAAVNGINDPARLRPGTTLYLPNADELV